MKTYDMTPKAPDRIDDIQLQLNDITNAMDNIERTLLVMNEKIDILLRNK